MLDTTRTPVLAALNEDSGAPVGAVGTLVSALIDFQQPAGQVDNVTDPDTDAQLGIAVIAADYGERQLVVFDRQRRRPGSISTKRRRSAIPAPACWRPTRRPGCISGRPRTTAGRSTTRSCSAPGTAPPARTAGRPTPRSMAERPPSARHSMALRKPSVRSTTCRCARRDRWCRSTSTRTAAIRRRVSLGLGGLAYGPRRRCRRVAQTLTYRIAAIPSQITLWLADGTTPVLTTRHFRLAQLQGLTYKTVSDANGSGNLQPGPCRTAAVHRTAASMRCSNRSRSPSTPSTMHRS